jgi:aminopeptidase N
MTRTAFAFFYAANLFQKVKEDRCMKNIISYFVINLLLFITTVVCGQQPENILSVSERKARTGKIDIIHTSLNLKFDWNQKQLHGDALIIFSPLITTESISLDAGMLTINSIFINNKVLKFRYDGSHENDALNIFLDRIYGPGDTIFLKIHYHSNWINQPDPNNLWGSFGKGVRFFEPSSTNPRKRKQAWSMGGPESNRYWFPCFDSPDDLQTTELTATVDSNLTVISNGILAGLTDNIDGTRTFHWKMDNPHANHQTSFVVGEYVDIKRYWDGIELHNFGYPDEADAVAASIERLPDMLRFFSEITGYKYPYKAYTQVFVQDFPWGGGHNISASTISENMIDDQRTHSDFLYLWDGIEANDLAAQWFGNLLSPVNWEHSWLNKSFATYFSILYNEYKNGPDEFALWNRLYNHNTYLNDWNNGVRRPLVTSRYDDPATFTNDNYASLYGAEVLHMLRKELGENDWKKSIRECVRSNAGKLVSTPDFLWAIEKVTGKRMGWFFEQWIYKMGHPVFDVSKQFNPGRKELTLKVKQIQQKDSTSTYPETQFFEGNMDICIDGRIFKVRMEAKAENIFTFKFFHQPKLVCFDHGNAWIKEVTFKKSFDEFLWQFEKDDDVLGRNWAMGKLVEIAKSDSTSIASKKAIYKAFRKVIMGNFYWRFRTNALARLRSLLIAPFDEETTGMLLNVSKKENSWLKTGALFFLSDTRDKKYASLYISCLDDKSDRVINAAAFALGRTKSPGAFDVLARLKDKPSWKNQSLISALNGLRELADPRGASIALTALSDDPAGARWTLANSTWDYRITAAETLVSLGKASDGYPIVIERFNRSMEEGDVSDIFNNVLLLSILGDARGEEIFERLKKKFNNDANAMMAVLQYEAQFKEAVKNNQTKTQ